jgi:hypothetical protein
MVESELCPTCGNWGVPGACACRAAGPPASYPPPPPPASYPPPPVSYPTPLPMMVGQQLRCRCGGAFLAPPGAPMVSCPFCGQQLGVPMMQPMAMPMHQPMMMMPMNPMMTGAPSLGLPITAGIFACLMCGLYGLMGLGALAVADKANTDDGRNIVYLWLLFAGLGIFEGVRTCLGNWRSALSSGILQAGYAILFFLATSALHDARFLRAVDKLASMMSLLALLSLITAILCFVAIGPAMRHREYKRMTGQA